MLVARWAVLVVLGLALSGCGGLGLPGEPDAGARVTLPTPTGAAPPALDPQRTPPGPTAPPPTAAPTPLPSPTPEPALPLRISARLEPPTPRAGTEFVVQLTVANDGQRPAHGVYIATSGPWDRWTVLAVAPEGNVARDAAGWRIISPVDIPSGETRTVEVRVRADAPSEDQLTFAVREAEPGELR